MIISMEAAEKITSITSEVLCCPVNIMDEYGIIVASTDRERVGTYHEAAREIILKDLDKLVIHTDNGFRGTKKGLNLPIKVEGMTVGVVGITGEPDYVSSFGYLLKNMTEIMIKELFLQDQKSMQERMREQYIKEWIALDENMVDESFISRGKALGINAARTYSVVLLSIVNHDELQKQAGWQIQLNKFEEILSQFSMHSIDNYFVKDGKYHLIILTFREEEKIASFVQSIRDETAKQLDIRFAAGADAGVNNSRALNESYRRAERALAASVMSKDCNVRFYSELTIEILLNEVSEKSKEEFVHLIFKNCSANELQAWSGFLMTFFQCNGSISQIAEKLFMHKNTIQYKIRRLIELTGYDPRVYVNAVLYGIFLYLQGTDGFH